MTVTVKTDTDIELNIKKLDEMLEKIKLLEENKLKMLNFLTIKQFSQLRGCSLKVSGDIFNLPDFPSENYGKQKVVEIRRFKGMVQNKKR